jgi:hypothetical protein
MEIIYERNGIYIEYNSKGAVFKKNGLTIEIPARVLEDFEREFDIKRSELIHQMYREMPVEDKYLVQDEAKKHYEHTRWHQGQLLVSHDGIIWMVYEGLDI